jgi:glucans biosynthesis protein
VLNRRETVAALAAGFAGPAIAQAPGNLLRFGPARPFSFEALKARARGLAGQPYVPPPAFDLAALDFDVIGQIRFRPEAALWKDRPAGAVEFFHLGRYARSPVAIHAVEGGQARPILYDEAMFEWPAGKAPTRLPPGFGFAGFRAMNGDGRTDWIAYQGASYFRSADPFNQYGLSARGLAIDTAAESPEEFPAFTQVWLERDAGEDLVVYALLDGPSVAGAYRIVHRRSPGGLVQEIEAEISFRKAVRRLGVAPLTSMYWYGQPDRARAVDWRPQIHDSDGLAMFTGAGERIWRPLANPPRVVTNAFADHDPRGFGLMQRDRSFADYQDDGVFYERRPSAWVEPMDAWGAGSVQLVEIPTDGEVNDNIVAFWTPAAEPTARQRLGLRYRLYWSDEEPAQLGVARVVATRTGVGGRPGLPPTPGQRKVVVDFQGGRLAALTRASGVSPRVTLPHGQPIDVAAYPIVGANNWRLMFDFAAPTDAALDLRAFLALGDEALTETWIYQVFPQ